MTTYQWAKHADAIEDARDEKNHVLLNRAVVWAITNDRPETSELHAALSHIFATGGNCNAASCETNLALEIVLDAYLEHRQGRAAA